MPYIHENGRQRLEKSLSSLTVDIISQSEPDGNLEGVLNYVFSELLLRTMPDQPRYRDLNRAIGVLECCKLELYRRLGSIIEDKAIKKNGDLVAYEDKS